MIRRAHGRPWMKAICLFLGVATLAACESGPEGPGSFPATIESSRRIAGGAVLDIRGLGIQGFTAPAPLRVFWSSQPETGSYRVVLINPNDAAPLTLQIQVADVSADPPTGEVIEATALTNLPLRDPSDFAVLIQR